MTHYLLLAAIVLLQIADAATTIYILERGGVELNPIMRRLMGEAGVRHALAIKILFVAAISAWVMFMHPRHATVALSAIAIAYMLIVCFNLVSVVRIRRGQRLEP
jgi:hypothetical protein